MLRLPLALMLVATALVPQSPPVGLDHMNIAVADLAAASDRFRALGFALKPGVPHANGIQNQHAKFPDGTELELITAPEARDSLTTKYRLLLAEGDGPAFLAFFVPPGVQRPEHPAGYVFFGGLNHSPTDRPEHFAHANTADALISVWLADADFAAEHRLLRGLGAKFSQRAMLVPRPHTAEVATLPDDDEIVLMPAEMRTKKGRSIVGATVRVRDLGVAQHVWARSKDLRARTNDLPAPPIVDAPNRRAFLPPATALGTWLEFREIARR